MNSCMTIPVDKVGLTILDQRKAKSDIKDSFVQTRDGNFDHLTRSEGRWGQSTQKACGHRGGISMRIDVI
jgi:hypothetical protein